MAAALLLAAGCGPPGIDYRGARVEREAPALDIPELAGTWSGSYTITRDSGKTVNVGGQIQATLNQRNGVLSGPTKFRQGTMQGNGMISGFVSANGSFSWTHTVNLASGGLTYQGNVSPDLMTLRGDFFAFNGSTSGTFSLRRDGAPPAPRPRPAPVVQQPAPPPPPPPPAPAAGMTGTWKLDITHADGFREDSRVTFDQQGQLLSGAIERDTARVNIGGSCEDGGRIRFGYQIRRRPEDPGLWIRFSGRSDGVSVRGSWSIDNAEKGTFVLSR
jgi:hypothetical protein